MSDASSERPLTPHTAGRGRNLAGLGAIALLSAVLIGGTWHYTQQRIAENAARRTLAEISTVLPASLYDNEPHRDVILLDTSDGQPLPVYRAWRNGKPVAAVLTVIAPDGYVGPIRLLVGIAADGKVLGVQVTAHAETPGIGAAISTHASTWLNVFLGRTLENPPQSRWLLRNDDGDFDAIAGATVSSRATLGGVRKALEYFATHRDEVFARPASLTETP
jgi:electron transport complex protein RnfG